MKKLIVMILIIIILFSSCKMPPTTYSFPHNPDQVVSVILLHNRNSSGEGTDQSNFSVIKELTPEESVLFVDEVYKLDTHRRYGGPYWGYGDYIAKITYDNGDVEMLGSLHIEFIPNGETATGYGAYHFEHGSFVTLLSNYAELPEPVGYIKD